MFPDQPSLQGEFVAWGSCSQPPVAGPHLILVAVAAQHEPYEQDSMGQKQAQSMPEEVLLSIM